MDSGHHTHTLQYPFLSPEITQSDRSLSLVIPATSVLVQEFCGRQYDIKLNWCSRSNELCGVLNSS